MSDEKWSPAARSVWGKTEKDGERFLPLTQHLEDAAAVAVQLWDNWLSDNVRRVIASGFGRSDAAGRAFVAWSAGVHDIGKASPGFAVKATYQPAHGHLVDDMRDLGLAVPPHIRGSSDRLPPHCHLGQVLGARWLHDRYGASPKVADALFAAVGAHHGTPPTALELRAHASSRWSGLNDPTWRAVQTEILDRMTSLTGADKHLSDWVNAPPPKKVQVLVSAVVVVADWLASDVERFPYAVRGSAEQRADRADLGRDLLGPWEPTAEGADATELLSQRFPKIPKGSIRPIQTAAVECARAMDEPGLMVMEAPMGVGKTEAALLAAEVLATRFGLGGVFIGLPTMATSDAMFNRVLAWTASLDSTDTPTIYLAHSKAQLNEKYQGLMKAARIREVNADEDDPHSAIVSTWLNGRRKGVLANMVVGTIDQALFGALKSRHLALRHLALASKVVILDEVHAADVYMRRYLVRVLEWLGAYGVPVVLLSATLPSNQLHELTDAYGRGRDTICPPTALGLQSYPRITVQTSSTQQVPVAWGGRETSVAVSVATDRTSWLDHIRDLVVAGSCVVVIQNTVARAQQAYGDLRDRVGPERIELLHSRFVAADRADREKRLHTLLGPPGPDVHRPRGFVVVGTQVLEQSLDIDADYMVSDHAPVDLLLQRMGRLHRHERGLDQHDRPAEVRQARLLLTGLDFGGSVPAFDSGSEAIYGRGSLLRSAATLSRYVDGEPVVLPTDIPALVEAAYDPNAVPPVGWEADWFAADAAARNDETISRQRARTFRLSGPSPDFGRDLVGWLEGRTTDGEEAQAGRAQVRDTEDGLEVLVVWRDQDGAVRILPEVGEHGGADLGVVQLGPPSATLALSVLACSVRLPQQLTRGERMSRVITELERGARDFEGWQQSPWLQGQLILCLDANLQASLAGAALTLDRELGLIVDEKGRPNEHG